VLQRSGRRPAIDLVIKFLEHFAAISQAMDDQGCGTTPTGCITTVCSPRRDRCARQVPVDGGSHPHAVAAVIDEVWLTEALTVGKQFADLLQRRGLGNPSKLADQGLLRGEPGDRHLLLSVVGIDRLERLFAKLFDTSEFLSPYGLRALSAYHRDHPYQIDVEGSAPRSTMSLPSPPPICSAGTPTGADRSGFRSTTF